MYSRICPMAKSIRVVISVFSWVWSSLNRERRSTVVFGDSPSIAEPNPVSMQDGHTNTIYNKHFNTVVYIWLRLYCIELQ